MPNTKFEWFPAYADISTISSSQLNGFLDVLYSKGFMSPVLTMPEADEIRENWHRRSRTYPAGIVLERGEDGGGCVRACDREELEAKGGSEVNFYSLVRAMEGLTGAQIEGVLQRS